MFIADASVKYFKYKCPYMCLKILILISFIEGVDVSGPSLNIVHRTPAPAVLFPALLGKGI